MDTWSWAMLFGEVIELLGDWVLPESLCNWRWVVGVLNLTPLPIWSLIHVIIVDLLSQHSAHVAISQTCLAIRDLPSGAVSQNKLFFFYKSFLVIFLKSQQQNSNYYKLYWGILAKCIFYLYKGVLMTPISMYIGWYIQNNI